MRLLFIGCIMLTLAGHARADQTHRFDIPAQELGRALKGLGAAANEQLLFADDVVAGLRSTPIKGEYTAEHALAILLEGSGLEASRTPSGVILIRAEGSAPSGRTSAAPRDARPLRLAQSESGGATSQRDARYEPASEEAGLQEVFVTARRRTESLQDVPISIVAKTGEDLQQSHVDDLSELDRLVPGFMMWEGAQGGISTLALRGISTGTSVAAGLDQSVGVAVDGVVLGAIGTVVTDFNDVERVEVLRGPQGTLFGRNTTGGLVHILTKDPVEEFEAEVSVGYGSYDEMKASASASGPLGGNLAARISAFAMNRDGFLKNVHDGRMMEDDQQAGVRTKFLYTPRESTRIKLGLYYIERHQSGTGGTMPVQSFGPDSSQLDREIYGEIARPGNDKVRGIGHHPYDDIIKGINLTWEQAIGSHTLTSISSYEYWRWNFGAGFQHFNAPEPPIALEKYWTANHADAWSQELRLAARRGVLDYVIGAYVNGDKRTIPTDFLLNVSGDPDPAAAIYLFDQDVSDFDSFTYAAFGEADFHVSDTVTLTAGTRWTYDRKKGFVDAVPVPGYIPEAGIGFDEQGRLYIPFLASAAPGIRRASTDASDPSWRTAIRWKPAPAVSVYGTVARGFKGPAISAVSSGFALVKPETATNYEIGLKTSPLGKRLTANLAVFRTDLDDFQAEGQDIVVTPEGEIPVFTLKNAGEARTEGAELELSMAPTENWLLDLNMAYVDARYLDYRDASCYEAQTVTQGCIGGVQDLSGKMLPYTPRFSANAGVRYEFTLPFWSLKEFIRVDYSYRSEVQWNRAIAPTTVEDPVSVVGLSFGIRDLTERFELVGFIKNLTDEFVVNRLTGGNQTITAHLQPDYQRTFGVTLNYRF